MIDDCTAVILAGGESSRMGTDKADVQLANDSLLNHAIRHMQPRFETLVVSVREPKEHLLLPQLCDRGDAQGPIMGIATALEHVNTTWVFVLACDMPFISAAMTVAMADKRDGWDAVVPCVGQVLQPLAAFYAQTCLTQMRSQITNRQRSMKTLISKVNAAIIGEDALRRCDPELLSFMDLDTPEDVARAEAVLAIRKI